MLYDHIMLHLVLRTGPSISCSHFALQFLQFVPASRSTRCLVLRDHGCRYVIAFSK